MDQTQAIVLDSVAKIFRAASTKERITSVEDGHWDGNLWDQVESAGLTQPHLLSDNGHDWSLAYLIAAASGRHCVPAPIAETMLASWLLTTAGMDVPAGPLTILALEGAARQVQRVPWARHCQHAVVVRADRGKASIGIVDLQGCVVQHGSNLALEPRDQVELGDANLQLIPTRLPANVLSLYGAMLRCAQMSGALQSLLDMSVQYASERTQFGRTISKFQIIQQELAKLAGYVASSSAASAAAFRAATEAGSNFVGEIGVAGDPTMEIASAKVVVGEAAEWGPRIAHQVHGAIGFTYEHSLHFASRRLWSWRAEFGAAETWAERLGDAAFAVGGDGLWPLITSR